MANINVNEEVQEIANPGSEFEKRGDRERKNTGKGNSGSGSKAKVTKALLLKLVLNIG